MNMEKTYMIGLRERSEFQTLEYPELPPPVSDEDSVIHNYVVEELLEIDFQNLVIFFSKEKMVLAMKLALHIRLTEVLDSKRLCKIILISDLLLDTVIRVTGSYCHILYTKGTKFLQNPTPQILSSVLHKLDHLNPDDFKNDFLKQILIQPDETIGRHSIANIWGALKMEKSAGMNVLKDNVDVGMKTKGLYFKYLQALQYDYKKLKPSGLKIIGKINLNKPSQIDVVGKRILLIDDEANKGWGKLLQTIFRIEKSRDFEIINERVGEYDDFSPESKNLIENGNFDLFLLDLRLRGNEEENIIKTENFSGFKVLKKIKSFNSGNQVIIFTASNKTWNLMNLIENGADGYYLKESPEYSFTDEIANESFRSFCKSVKEALQMSYLRKFRVEIDTLKQKDFSYKNIDFKDFTEKSFQHLEAIYRLLQLNRKQDIVIFRSVFLLFYQIIEEYCRLKSIYDGSNQILTLSNGKYKKAFEEKDDDIMSALTFVKEEIKTSKRPKLISIRNQPCLLTNEEKINFKRTIDSMPFKFAFIGYFYLGLNESSINSFIRLNEIRNDIAHGHPKLTISITEIKDIFQLVKEVFK